MAKLLTALYEALLDTGVSEETAAQATEAIAALSQRLAGRLRLRRQGQAHQIPMVTRGEGR